MTVSVLKNDIRKKPDNIIQKTFELNRTNRNRKTMDQEELFISCLKK